MERKGENRGGAGFRKASEAQRVGSVGARVAADGRIGLARERRNAGREVLRNVGRVE